MIKPFSEMPLNSRIWIYQSNRKFINLELEDINIKISNFLKTKIRNIYKKIIKKNILFP